MQAEEGDAGLWYRLRSTGQGVTQAEEDRARCEAG